MLHPLMQMQWHDYLALALFAAAAAMVVRRAYRAVVAGAKSGCASGCGTCAGGQPGTKRLLTIDANEGGWRDEKQF